MTYYAINNVVINQIEYFVPDEQTKLANDHLVCIVGNEQDAKAKIENVKQDYINQESYRFTIAKEEVNGNDTTWRNADLLNDSEEGVYHVFNHETGLHETLNGLSNAITRSNEIKQKFIDDTNLVVVYLDKLPPKVNYVSSIYGETVGTIPVEVM